MPKNAKAAPTPYSSDSAGQIFHCGQMVLQVSLNVPPNEREGVAAYVAELLNLSDKAGKL